jgi:hypothetical protein
LERNGGNAGIRYLRLGADSRRGLTGGCLSGQVYDVTDENSFNNIRNWIKNIEQHASDKVNKILIGSKADLVDKKVRLGLLAGHSCCLPSSTDVVVLESLHCAVTFLSCSFSVCALQKISTERGKALADEYGIKFFEAVRRRSAPPCVRVLLFVFRIFDAVVGRVSGCGCAGAVGQEQHERGGIVSGAGVGRAEAAGGDRAHELIVESAFGACFSRSSVVAGW